MYLYDCIAFRIMYFLNHKSISILNVRNFKRDVRRTNSGKTYKIFYYFWTFSLVGSINLQIKVIHTLENICTKLFCRLGTKYIEQFSDC